MNDAPDPREPRRALHEWQRLPEERKIAGVCAGLAEELGVSVTVVRAAFVLLALPPFSGVGIALYLVLWFLMPTPGEPSGLDRLVQAVGRLTDDPPRRKRRAEPREIEDPDEL